MSGFDARTPSIARLYDFWLEAEITALLSPYEVVPPGITEARVWLPGWTELPVLPPRTGEMLAAVARVG